MDDADASARFHTLAQAQIARLVGDLLARSKLGWDEVRPLLEAARAVCRAELEADGSLSLHAVQDAADGALAPADEAYVSLAVRDRDEGTDWAQRSWWLSDLITAGGDPELVREALAGVERSLARARAWLEAQEQGSGDPA
jgi:hypothetical protein